MYQTSESAQHHRNWYRYIYRRTDRTHKRAVHIHLWKKYPGMQEIHRSVCEKRGSLRHKGRCNGHDTIWITMWLWILIDPKRGKKIPAYATITSTILTPMLTPILSYILQRKHEQAFIQHLQEIEPDTNENPSRKAFQEGFCISTNTWVESVMVEMTRDRGNLRPDLPLYNTVCWTSWE